MGFKFSIETPTTLPVAGVGEMNAAQTAAQQHAQTANDALVYVRTVKLRFSGDQSHVYEAFLDIMRDFKSGRYVPLSLDSPLSLSAFPPRSDHICLLSLYYVSNTHRYDTTDVVKRIKKLLKGHEDLLDGFNCFLPDVSEQSVSRGNGGILFCFFFHRPSSSRRGLKIFFFFVFEFFCWKSLLF